MLRTLQKKSNHKLRALKRERNFISLNQAKPIISSAIIAEVFVNVWQQFNHQRIAYPKGALELKPKLKPQTQTSDASQSPSQEMS